MKLKFLIIAVFFSLNLFAQNSAINLTQYTSSEGLSQNSGNTFLVAGSTDKNR